MINYENLKKANQTFFKEFEKSFHHSLASGWYILGNNVKAFENDFANYCNTTYCVGVACGLDALTLSLKAYNFEPDAEIIVPSNTYIATILAIIQAGLKPVLVEPNINSYNIDPSKITEKISTNTRAVLVVHLYGKVCDMDSIIPICKKNNLQLIEDCAQAHGATYNNQKAGSFGDIGCFSHYPTKNLGAIGDAGSITTNNERLQKVIRKLQNYGSSIKYKNEMIGYNSRLDEIQAGFLSIKLKKLNDINNHKRALAKIYLESLSNNFIKPVTDNNYHDVYHIFNIRHPDRDTLKKYLEKNEILTEIHYPIPPHKQEAMKGILDKEPQPISEEIHRTTLSLPISYSHTEDEIRKVVDVLNSF